MKIAVIRRKYDPQGGGAEKYASYVVEELISRGHEVTVFAEKSFNVPEHITIVSVPRSVLPSLCRTAAFAANARKIVGQNRFDVVFAMSRYVGADVYRQAEQLHAVWLPIYYSSFARFNPRHSGILKLEHQVFDREQTGAVVTNSKLVKSQISDTFGFPEQNIRVIRNGVDRQRFYPNASEEERGILRDRLGLDRNAIVLLFVAGNFKIKGLDRAISSVAALDTAVRTRIKLVVIGGDDQTAFQQQADQLGVGESLYFAGKQNDMRSYYAASDLLLYPSLYEPFANVCLESCACGIPVITTKQNGSSELIEDGENGYIVDSAADVEAMTSALERFVTMEHTERKAFSAAAIKATEGYCWKGHVDQLEQLFDEIKTKKSR